MRPSGPSSPTTCAGSGVPETAGADLALEAASVRSLTEALVLASQDLWTCRDGQAVLERTVDAIHACGFWTSVLLLDASGDAFVHGPMREDLDSIRNAPCGSCGSATSLPR